MDGAAMSKNQANKFVTGTTGVVCSTSLTCGAAYMRQSRHCFNCSLREHRKSLRVATSDARAVCTCKTVHAWRTTVLFRSRDQEARGFPY